MKKTESDIKVGNYEDNTKIKAKNTADTKKPFRRIELFYRWAERQNN